MRIVQSFWSKPFHKKENVETYDRARGGWLFEKIYFMSTALSCLNLKKFYNDITLVTDEFGKHLLIDVLQLPYSNVIVELDKLNHYHEGLWALGKIYAYSIQNTPFLHVDNDVFIWKPFDEALLSKDVILQNFERNVDYYQAICHQVKENKFVVPPEMKQYVESNGVIASYSAVNAGILGGNNISFIKDYTRMAFELIDMNYRMLPKININRFNVFYEQSLFYCLAISKNMNMGYLFETISPDFSEICKISMVPYSWYIHVVGPWKMNIEMNEAIYNCLSIEYPDYFHKINKLYK